MSYLDWLQGVFIPEFFAVDAANGRGNCDYHGDRLGWRDRRFLVDSYNYRVGPARIRQLRVPKRMLTTFRVPWNFYSLLSVDF